MGGNVGLPKLNCGIAPVQRGEDELEVPRSACRHFWGAWAADVCGWRWDVAVVAL